MVGEILVETASHRAALNSAIAQKNTRRPTQWSNDATIPGGHYGVCKVWQSGPWPSVLLCHGCFLKSEVHTAPATTNRQSMMTIVMSRNGHDSDGRSRRTDDHDVIQQIADRVRVVLKLVQFLSNVLTFVSRFSVMAGTVV